MPELRFRGLAAQNSTFGEFLEERFGYKAVRDGNDWIVPATDRRLRLGPKDVLSVHSEMLIESSRFDNIASELIRHSPAAFEEFIPERVPINIPADLGLISQADKLTIQITMANRNELHSLISTQLLPFMAKIGATHVTAISIDPNQQTYISLTKIAYLVQKFGLEHTGKLLQHSVLQNISPHPLAVLGYVDHFTNIVPRALTLPVYRRGVAWHFYRTGGWTFLHGSTIGLPAQFQSHSHPASDSADFAVLRLLGQVSTDDIWRALRLVAFAINNLAKFLNNPVYFSNASGEADFFKQLQTASAVNLLFADLGRIAADSDSHSRMVFALAAFAKLANLRNALGPGGLREAETMRALASLSQARELRRIYERVLTPRWPDHARWLKRATSLFQECHRHLAHELGKPEGLQERVRLLRLGAHRNLIHGAFLTGQQFDRLFVQSRGDFPPEIAALPFHLTLALMLAPRDFLNFRPRIRGA